MILLILILLFLAPLFGFVLGLIGVGSRYESEVLLPGLRLEQVKSLLIFYSRNNTWPLLHQEISEEKALFVFQAHRWGNNKSGIQEITVTFFPDDTGLKGFIRSRSLLGQFVDFGINQKNVEELSFFLSDASKQEYILKQPELSKAGFLPRNVPIDWRYFGILAGLIAMYFLITVTMRLSKVVVPGYIEVRFRQKTAQEGALQWMHESGGINCKSQEDDPLHYICEVPVTQEWDVADKIGSNYAVQYSQPVFKK